MDYKDVQRIVGHSPPGRPEHDDYDTCEEATLSLLAVEEFDGVIWEPACGRGAITKVLEKHNLKVVSTDLYDYGFGASGIDFLNGPFLYHLCYSKHIVTNPPFKFAIEFAYRGCKLIEKTGGKLCLLNRVRWLASQKRQKLFESTPLARVHIFSRRLPFMHRPGHSEDQKTTMLEFAWFVWEAGYEGPPTLNWIDWKEAVV